MLNIYVEKEFLDDFYVEYDEDQASKVQKIVYKMLVDYPETKLFLNYEVNSPEELNQLKIEQPIFAAKAANNILPQPVDSLKEEVLKQTENKTSVVFTAEKQDWFDEAEKQGILCFPYKNYEKKIGAIINSYRYKIDLSEEGFNWEKLKFISTFNQIKINDNYILVDKDTQKIDSNFSPLIKNAIQTYDKLVDIEIYTSNFNPKQPGGNQQIQEAAQAKNQKINRVFANYNAGFKIINNSINGNHTLNFHDRMILTNFQIVDCGKGFNLIPHKPSNSQIVSETIFDFYSYKRLKNLLNAHNKYFRKITSDKFQTSEFTCL